MNEKILISLGLSGVQAEVFSCLLQNGPQKASDIAKLTKRPRGVAYKGLEELISLGLANKKEAKAGIAVFAAEHPSNLEKVIEQKEKDLAKTKSAFASSLPDLISTFNLVSNKPGVRFYEGEEGIKKSLEDTLNCQDIIYTFADIEAVEKNVKEINDAYAKKREKAQIKKRVIVADTPFNRSYLKNYNGTITEFRFLPKDFYSFNSGVQIYENKVSYQVISAENKMAIIIEDKNIYQMNKLLFEFIWEKLATKINDSSQTPNT
ncbi:MAG: helix-turn-helix domain-containing protein [Patescibacteria group bacterium]